MLRLAAAAAGLVLPTPRLTAQTLPVPVLPPAPSPQPEPSPSPAGTQPVPARAEAPDAPTSTRARPWEYVLGLSVSWDGNIDFLGPDGPSGVAVVPRGGLTRVFSTPRGQWRATLAAGGIDYPDDSGPRRYYGDLGVDGGYRSSPSTEWRASASYGVGYSDSSRILLEQGVSLPIVKTRSLAGALGVSRKTGPRTSLRIDGRFYRTEFDSSSLVDGASARVTIGLERQLDTRDTATIGYSLEDVLSGQKSSYATHFASLQWTRLLSARSALLVEGGGSYTPDALRAALEQKGSFFGGASYTRQVRGSSVTLFLRREVTPAFGIGLSRVALRSGVRAGVPIGRAWQLRINTTHVRPDNPGGGGTVYASSDEAFAAVGRRLGRRFELTIDGRYRRRGATSAAPSISAFDAGLFLTLTSLSSGGIVLTPTR
jgi:hypothetical protein